MPRRVSPPYGFLLAMVLIFAIESVVARCEVGWMTPGELSWRVTAWSATHRSRECDILCLGDSQIKQAVAPAVLEARTGRKAYNLALVGGSAPTSYFLLRRALEAGARPSAVIVGFKPNLLAGDPDIGRRIWGEALDFRDAAELSIVAKDPHALAILMLTKTLPSARSREAIRSRWSDQWLGKTAPAPSPTVPMNQHANRNQGALLFEPNPYYRTPLLAISDGDPLFSARPKVHPINEAYLENFLDLAASRRIAVYWVLPPIDPFAQSWRERKGFEADYEQFLRGYSSNYPNLTILDARHAGYGPAALWDQTHLNHAGATAFSDDLASILLESKPGRRWVAMPEFRKRPENPALDKLDLIALMARAKR